MLGEDFLSHLLLSFVDIRVQLVSIFLDRELLVVVDWDENFLRANWFLVFVMEL